MKSLLLYILLVVPAFVNAQVDRSKAPAPFPAPVIKIGTPATFTLDNGLKVFVVKNSKLPRVTANLTIDFTEVVEGDKAGLSSMAGSLIRRGTKKMKKAELDEAIDLLGASVNTSGTNIVATSLSNNFPEVFRLMSEMVLNPSLPVEELEKIRNQELSGLQANKDDPGYIAQNVVRRLMYGKNHPYGDIETEETIKNIKVEDVKSYLSTYWQPNNAYLIFVGDITLQKAKALAQQHLSAWKKGAVLTKEYAVPQHPAKTYIAVVDRPASVQSVINLVTPIELKPGTNDVIPSSVMNNLLGGGMTGRLFQNLREKHGFTYGATSSLSSDKLVGAFKASASVRNEKTDSAVAEFINEFNRIRDVAASDSEINTIKNYLAGSFARSLETPGTIAQFALNVARYKLSPTYYQDYLLNLANVKPATVQLMAKKYVLPAQMHIVVVGNAKEIAPGLQKFGEVKYFDVYGNEITPPVVKKADAGVTAEKILKKAAEAIATQEAMAAIKSIEMYGEVDIMGNKISVAQKQIIPTMYVTAITMNGQPLQQQMVKNGKYTIVAQGQTKEADAAEREEIDEKAAFFDDNYYLNLKGASYTLGDIEKVNGTETYPVTIKTPAGRTFTNYYDVATGLKLKSSTSKELGPLGQVNIQTFYKDYKTYNGVKIPTNLVVDLGRFKQDIKFTDVKINTGITEKDIK